MSTYANSGSHHGSESRSHSVDSVELGKFHSTGDESRNDLTSVVDDSILSNVHVELK